MSITAVAKFTGLHWQSVKEIEKRYLAKKYAKVSLGSVRRLGIDEVYLGRKFGFITVVRNMDSGAVLFIGKGKGGVALDPLKSRLRRKARQIEAVAMDMSNAYSSWIGEVLPNAEIVYDHFHVIKLMNERMDALRRSTMNKLDEEQKKELKGQRYLFLRNQEDLSFDARLVSPGDQALRWIGGIYLAEIEREVVVGYGADTGNGFDRTPYVPADGPNPTDLLFWDDFDTTVYAVYGQIEFDLTDTLEIALAGRYDREEREVTNKVPNVSNSGLNINLLDDNFQPTPINPAFNSNPNGIPKRDDTYSQFQPKLTLNWAATDNMNIYGSYGVGFRSGGFNSVGTEDLLNFWFNAGYGGAGEAVNAQIKVTDDYDKEVSEAFEVGMKSEFMDRRLRLNAALFRTDVEDNQFFEFFAGPFGLLRSVTTIDEMYIQGFEADITFIATEGLTFYGGVGLMDSEIEKNKNRPLSEGNDVPQAPETTGNLGAEWVIALSTNINLVSRLDWSYVGETWFHTLQGEQTPTIWNAFFGPGNNQDFSKSSRDAYDTLDLRIGLEADNWRVTAWGRNITDEKYLEEVIPAPEFGGSFNHQSAQRSYGLDFSYLF